MTRIATAGVLTEVAKEIIRPLLLVELDFPSGFVRMNTTNSSIVFDSDTYLGVGNLGKISSTTESSNLQADGVDIELLWGVK